MKTIILFGILLSVCCLTSCTVDEFEPQEQLNNPQEFEPQEPVNLAARDSVEDGIPIIIPKKN